MHSIKPQCHNLCCAALLASALASSATAVLAQAAPDAGRLLQEIERSAAPPPRPEPRAIELPGGEAPLPDSGVRVLVQGFRIQGASVFSEAELQALLHDFVGQALNFPQLQSATAVIARHYRAKGFLARALLPRQTIAQGLVDITVIEGRLGEVSVAAAPAQPRLEPEVARRMLLAQQASGALLRPDAVQYGLRLINELPGIQASASLLAGTEAGTSNVLLDVLEAPLFSGQVMLDNAGALSTGKERLLASLLLHDPSGQGDQLSLMGLTASGTQFVRAGYQLRAGYSGLRVGVQASNLRYAVGAPLQSLDANGSADILGLSLAYPLARSNSLELDLNASTETKSLVNNANHSNTSHKALEVYTLGINASRQDALWGGGKTQWAANVVMGRLHLDANVADAASDLLGARTQGDFSKLTYSAARLQGLGARLGLNLALSGQMADHNLDSSEQFTLGGPTGVRAFALSEASGDEGWLLSSELRYQWSSSTQFQAFVDTGGVRLHHALWSGWDAARSGQPNGYQLAGLGFGFSYSKPGDFTIKGSVAWRLGDNPGTADNRDSDGTRESPRLWVQFSKTI